MAENQEWYVESKELADATPWDGENTGPDGGDYELIVAELGRKTSSVKGIPMVTVKSEIVRNADGSESDQKGRFTFAQYPEEGKGTSRLKQFIGAVNLTFNSRGGVDLGKALGRSYLATVYKETYNAFDMEGNATPRIGTRIMKERAIPGSEGNGEAVPAKGTKAQPARTAAARR